MSLRLMFALAAAATAFHLTLTIEAHAATSVKAPVTFNVPPPSEPCDFDHRMDVIVVHGVWFECSCEALMVGTVCDWYEITSSAPEADRLALRRLVRSPKRIVRLKSGGVLYVPRIRPVIA